MKSVLSIICGIDMIVAMISFALVSHLWGIAWDWKLLCWSIVFAHAPDASMAIYPFIKKWVIKTFGIPSHRPLTHHPLIVIPMAIVFCYLTAPYFGYPVMMFVLLAVINLMGHFTHDSIEPQGFHWLSPLSWERITLKNFIPEYVPVKVWKAIHWEKEKEYRKSSGDEFTKRADPLPGLQIFIWFFSGILIVFYGFFPQFAQMLFVLWGTLFIAVSLILTYSGSKANGNKTETVNNWANVFVVFGYTWTGFWALVVFMH